MITNKRGMSGIIVTLITILLAIVAIGIVWVIVTGVIDKNADNIDKNTMCQDALFKITNVEKTGDTCSVTVERVSGMTQEIGGIDVSVNDGTAKPVPNNIIFSKTITEVECDGDLTTAEARVYIEVDEEKKYCPGIGWSA